MAYADTNTRPNTPSLIVAIGVNAALIGAVILAAPDIAPDIGYIGTKIYPVTPDAPPDKRVEVKETPKAKPDPRPFTPPKPDDTAKPEGGGLILPPGGTDPILPPGSGIDPKPFVPQPPSLTIIGAKPHPGYARDLQPSYPPGMIRAEREGVVTLRVLIGTDGRVLQVSVISAETPEFAAATERQALKKWRFLPATRDGVPFESWREMTVRFKLPRE